MLGVGRDALRRRLTPDHKWVEIYGGRIRTYPIDHRPNTQLRFDADEITRFLISMQKGRPRIPKETRL